MLVNHIERVSQLQEALRPFARRLAERIQIAHFPRRLGLRRQHPGLVFHAVPEIFFQLSGTNHFTCPSERFKLKPEQIAIISRWLPHGERYADTRKAPFAGVVVGLDPGLATFRWQCPGADSRPSSSWTIPCAGQASDQLAGYLDDLTRDGTGSPAFRASLLQSVVLLMLDLLQVAGRENRENPSVLSTKVQRCREIIQSELSDPDFGVRTLARELQCTADHLSCLFRAECGIALNAFIRAERLRHAKALIADQSLNVSEIAWACGFRSPNYFIRCFRVAYGSTPGKLQHTISDHKTSS